MKVGAGRLVQKGGDRNVEKEGSGGRLGRKMGAEI